MSTLKEKAAASWDATSEAQPVVAGIADPPAPQPQDEPLVPFADLPDATSDDPPPVTVHVAWARVMRDVQGIGKHGLYNAGGTRYNFRGVDAIINAFGPACRRHGVIVVPCGIRSTHGDAVTTKGNATREATVIVSWRIYGPLGDFIDGESEGESLDSSDKGSAKAQSVALRAFLIAAGLVPTDEKDPDSQHIERGERPTPKATDYVEEICNPRTSLARLLTIKGELERFNLGDRDITNEVGEPEPLGNLLWRKGRERQLAQEKSS